ncbi:hypothetical protein ACM66B_005377 [Microbotryomycetes sp. NB124-2]
MLPWSRSTSTSSASSSAAAPSDDSSLAGSAGHAPRSRLAHRTGGSTSRMQRLDEAQAVTADDEPWDEGSDDETTKQQLNNLATRLSHMSLGQINTRYTSASPPTRPAQARTPSKQSPSQPNSTSSPSSWFNPFSMLGSLSSPTSTSHPQTPTAHRPGPEAVAEAIGGGTASGGPLSRQATPTRGTSYLATANKVQEEADKVVEQQEEQQRQARMSSEQGRPSTSSRTSDTRAVTHAQEDDDREDGPHRRAKRSSTYQLDQCREAVKKDVLEIVKDPVSLLDRLDIAPPVQPVPRVSIDQQSTQDPAGGHRRSTSSVSVEPNERNDGAGKRSKDDDDDDEDDEDPAAGYVQLDATNYSSTGPEIVDYNKEQEPEETAEQCRERRRRKKFFDCLQASNVDLAELRGLAWSGIPSDLRPAAWQLLLGYLPAPASRRVSTLARKRQEYADAVRLAFSRGVNGLDGPIWHQISIDVPRTNAGVRLWQGKGTQRSLERILYVWAIRHPASGYVQGINDLVTPFFQVFLSSYIESDPEEYDVSALPPTVLEALEADSFWCLSKLLDGIQDNYIFAQPGITRQVARMKELCSRVDAPLAVHLEDNGVEFIQFAFRWMNCLLMREMNVKNIIRMWDTYLAEGGDAFSEFHLYVCLAFLVRWSDQLREMDFQSIIMFLQSLPTQGWTDKEIELLLSEAFMWSRTFRAR